MQSETANAPEYEPERSAGRGSWFSTLLILVLMLALGAAAFFFGFKLATESDLTVGDVLRFLRHLYQWFGTS